MATFSLQFYGNYEVPTNGPLDTYGWCAISWIDRDVSVIKHSHPSCILLFICNCNEDMTLMILTLPVRSPYRFTVPCTGDAFESTARSELDTAISMFWNSSHQLPYTKRLAKFFSSPAPVPWKWYRICISGYQHVKSSMESLLVTAHPIFKGRRGSI